jgi:hypothetical protein
MNKKLTIVVLLSLGLVFLGRFLIQQQEEKGLVQQASIVSEESSQEEQFRDRLEEIKNEPYAQKCIQSAQDLKNKRNELLPGYKIVLEKELQGSSLSKEDEYIKYLYSFLNSPLEAAKRLMGENSYGDGALGMLEETWSILQMNYCPDVANISPRYPMTQNTCYEIAMSLGFNMPPYEVLKRDNYQLEEEYLVEKAKYERNYQSRLVERQQWAKQCCSGGNDGLECYNFRKHMGG